MTVQDEVMETQADVPQSDREPVIESARDAPLPRPPPPAILIEELQLPTGMPLIESEDFHFLYWLCRTDLVYGHSIVVGEVHGTLSGDMWKIFLNDNALENL